VVQTEARTGPRGASSPRGSTYQSLALKYVLRRFRSTEGSKVLDLGPAIGRNVQFLSAIVSKLYIADLHHTLRSGLGRSAFDRTKLNRIVERDLPATLEGPIDLILVWDLFDYLDRDQMKHIGRRLAGLCRRETLLLAMISTAKTLPEFPTRFLMLDAENLLYENDSQRERPAPGYREPDLERLLGAFEVETSFLLRNGIQEYVLAPRSLPPVGDRRVLETPL
jgi:hypothetical protein